MRSIKVLSPVLILIFLGFYSYNNFYNIPEAILTGTVFLPVMLALIAVAISFHFNRSHIFFYVVLTIVSNIILGLQLAATDLEYALFSLTIPVLLLAITILPERGIFTARAIPVYFLIVFSFIASLLMSLYQPQFAIYFVLTNWLPPQYFDWTQHSQLVVFTSFFVFIYMLVLYFIRVSSQMATGLGVLIMLVSQLHFGGGADSLNVFSIISLLMCIYAVIHESWRMAYLDELTDLPTRRALREKFQSLGGLYTVAMLDVDHFKKFNDTFGHDTGDAVLRMIATKMKKVSGGGASFRYGGEEFTIVFNGKDAATANQYIEALREKIANTPFVINRASRRKNDHKSNKSKNKSVRVTVSIGVADSKDNNHSPWALLKQADKALYRAKKKGRNCVCS